MDFEGGEKKLRQAKFFLQHLAEASDGHAKPAEPEHLEFYLSACLTAAQSAYYVLDASGGSSFTAAQKAWRASLPDTDRSQFTTMIGVRDKDVHHAHSATERLVTWVPERIGNIHVIRTYAPMVEAENPDGTKVRGWAVRGATGLYFDVAGRKVEARTAALYFIAQIESLLVALRAGAT